MSIQFGFFLYLIVIFSAVFHEFMHGWMADRLGDPTAKNLGRLTLNPVAHIDPIGTLILPLFMILFTNGGFIGWAKPVPYNPYNLSDPKWGNTKVAIAGPFANFVIAAIFGLLLRFGVFDGSFATAVNWIVYINIYLGLFNLIPIPPLDGSKLIMDIFPRSRMAMGQLSILGIFLAIFIGIAILSPIAGGIFQIFTGDIFYRVLPF